MTRRRRIRLVHWKQEEIGERAARLEAVGYEVDGDVPGTSIGIRELRENPPTAFVIDLGRLPSHGREVASALRQLAANPLDLLVRAADEDDRDRSQRLRLPRSDSGPRSGRPLAEKLGVKEGMTIAAIDAPAGIERTLAPLPPGVTLRSGNRGRREMTLWFVTSRAAFERRLPAVARAVGEGTLWMAWPKRSSGVETDLSEDAIREVVLPAGLVDTKVCAIDDTWSGLRLTRRRS
jgi:hypothetical protein